MRNPEDFLVGGGTAGELARTLDWSQTPLGAVADWPENLKVLAATCLASQTPSAICWGPDFVCIYNDFLARLIGDKHPAAMGAPAARIFAEIWTELGPPLNEALTSGIPAGYTDKLLALDRHGFLEECYFTFSLAPIRNADGAVGGIFCTVHETTRRVLGERRLRTLRELFATALHGEAPEDVCRRAAEVLAGASDDVPFALFFLSQGGEEQRLIASSGLPSEVDQVLRDSQALRDSAEFTASLEQVCEQREGFVGEGLAALISPAATVVWPGWTRPLMVVPLTMAEHARGYGFVLVGLSPRLPSNPDYRAFIRFIGIELAAAITNAKAQEEAGVSAALQRVGEIISSDFEPKSMLQVVTGTARTLCGAAFGAFFYADGGHVAGDPVATAGDAPEALVQESSKLAGALLNRAFTAKAAIRLDDLSRSENSDEASAGAALGVRSCLAVPVFSRTGRIHGGWLFLHPVAGRFTARHERLLTGLAAHSAIAIDNANLLMAERSAQTELSRALAIRDNFLSIASHELRNPMNSLQLRLNLLKREVDGLIDMPSRYGDRLTGHVDKAALQINRMARLLDRLLDVSRIASGRLQFEAHECDLDVLVTQTCDRIADQAAPGQIRIVAADAVRGNWDDLRIEEVLTNLLSNALKYGEGKPVEVALRAGSNFAEITVTDRGIGIAAEDQQRIFERFERVDTDQRRGGLGLGLWISQQIIRAMGGRISLASEPDRGSTFTVWLPRGSAEGNVR